MEGDEFPVRESKVGLIRSDDIPERGFPVQELGGGILSTFLIRFGMERIGQGQTGADVFHHLRRPARVHPDMGIEVVPRFLAVAVVVVLMSLVGE